MTALKQPVADHESGLTAADLDQAYRSAGAKLHQLVRRQVRAPEPVVEDACQMAWSRLVRHAPRVHRQAVFPWLLSTAVREAVKSVQRTQREASWDAVVERGEEWPGRCLAPAPEQVLEHRQRLEAIALLPERQQRLLWLAGAGLSYDEMAEVTSTSRRSVERQVLRAKRAIRELAPA